METKKLFRETDGVRGKANFHPLDTDTVLKFGKALAEYVKKKVKPNPNREERFGIKMLCKVETQDGHSLFLARIIKDIKQPWFNIL